MQFTLFTVLSLVAVALAGPIRLDARAPQVASEAAAMTNSAGEVVAFDSTSVVQPATAAGA
ncbi:hypothetical protein GLAREA_05212 [Glarea lozoyensis ATCC 20868]|uniref:Uncharacterized protein n=1 Tax=Glarea lozoyensis (strain ATCC 20868 / MF5171) TaxID=1116229 RepID=S3DFI5_GLAL2|nr:uncharacterized protein GLAREA_05212 [Glarea lozoyensis ATCC 20868]EPE35874.1 hypothetical protein GLAREA_05212 [Glarea lozoyensis ATCC 20868]